MPVTEKSLPPAYVAYATWKNTIRGIAPSGAEMPSHIDRSMLPKLSFSIQAQFLASLRFFDLIDADGRPSKELEKLARASDAEWKVLVKKMLEAKYPKELAALKSGTPIKFRQSFGDFGGSVITYASRFLFFAAQDVGLPVSHQIKGIAAEKKPKKPKTETSEHPGGGGDRGDKPKPPEPVAIPETAKAVLYRSIIERLIALDLDEDDPAVNIGLIKAWQGAAKMIHDLKI